MVYVIAGFEEADVSFFILRTPWLFLHSGVNRSSSNKFYGGDITESSAESVPFSPRSLPPSPEQVR